MNYTDLCRINMYGMYTTWHVYYMVCIVSLQSTSKARRSCRNMGLWSLTWTTSKLRGSHIPSLSALQQLCTIKCVQFIHGNQITLRNNTIWIYTHQHPRYHNTTVLDSCIWTHPHKYRAPQAPSWTPMDRTGTHACHPEVS